MAKNNDVDYKLTRDQMQPRLLAMFSTRNIYATPFKLDDKAYYIRMAKNIIRDTYDNFVVFTSTIKVERMNDDWHMLMVAPYGVDIDSATRAVITD